MGGVLVIGAGGHARVSIEVLQAAGLEVLGCISNDGRAAAEVGVPMLGRDADLVSLIERTGADVFVAIGDNRARLSLLETARHVGARLVTAIDPRATVSPTARIGDGVLLMPGATVNAGTTLGEGTIVNTNTSIDHDCVVGRGVHVAPGSAVAGGVTLGDGVFLGIGTCVVPGVTIGEWTVVGAGGAVIGDLPPHVTAVGVPARPLEDRPA